MSGAGHPYLRDDLAAYALGALSDSEADAIEAHLAGCRECAAYLRRLWPAVDALATSVPQLEPPPALRDRLVTAVREEARRLAAAGAGGAAPGRARSPWRWIVARPAAALAAGALLVAGAAVGYAVHGGGSTARSVIPVRSMPGAGGRVTASFMEVDGQGMLRVRHAPPLRHGHVYEVWTERGGRMRAASTFVPRRDGTAMAAVPHVGDASVLFVTEERRGGSMQPTSPPLMRANLG
jgi:anti-sigma-K factor RskA